VVVALVVAGAWVLSRSDGPESPASVPTVTAETALATTSSTAPASTADATTTTGSDARDLSRILRGGSTGDDVAMVQRRLNELGFLVGEPDGRFGPQTEQAVWAFKKLVARADPGALADDERSSDVTPELWAQLRDLGPVEPRREINATHVEIYLPEQVLAVFDRGTPLVFAHITSGDGRSWCDEITYDTDASGLELTAPLIARECGVGRTPGGVFEIHSVLRGARRTPIGDIRDPVFFNHVIAIHGVDRAPLVRSTRGGVGVSDFVAAVIADVVELGVDVLVWGDDRRDPEEYSPAESLPTFNSLDPRCIVGLYTLREGDTRTVVAAKFDITEAELNGANVATAGYLEFLPGLEIIIPPTDCAPPDVPDATGPATSDPG
jgi:hypothetical protein